MTKKCINEDVDHFDADDGVGVSFMDCVVMYVRSMHVVVVIIISFDLLNPAWRRIINDQSIQIDISFGSLSFINLESFFFHMSFITCCIIVKVSLVMIKTNIVIK